jgi:hypothetical protein
MILEQRDANGLKTYQAQYPYAQKDELFQRNWRPKVRLVDDRDQMHKRGWTYFTVQGRISGQKVAGTGRIAFTYAAAKDHTPWMRLRIGDRRFIDRTFKGFSRPWMGLHTIDIIRRDAAEEKIPFETKHGAEQGKVQITLSAEGRPLVYTIDMETDVVEKITLSVNEGEAGELLFSYMQDIEGAGSEFAEPSKTSFAAQHRRGPGIFRLFKKPFGE